MANTDSITQLLQQWHGGDDEAFDKLCPLVYQELHRIANHYMHRERKEHTLQPTALVNEALLKLLGHDANWSDRKHFYAVAARLMRHILVDHARTRARKKRGHDYARVTLDENRIAAPAEVSILEIDEALQALQKVDPRKHDMLELYYFAGLKMEDIAQAYAVTSKTVQRELRMAEAWLSTVLYTDENDT